VKTGLRFIAITIAAGLTYFAAAGYAGAATPRPAGTCAVTAVRITGRIISAARTKCVQADGKTTVTAIPANTKQIVVGYGCQFKDFSRKGSCWKFAVAAPGCRPGSAWTWGELGGMKNKMESWKAIRTCHSGEIYSKPNLKGHSKLCSASCKSLGRLNDHDVSLAVGYGKTP
jgi:hypothetical protein